MTSSLFLISSAEACCQHSPLAIQITGSRSRQINSIPAVQSRKSVIAALLIQTHMASPIALSKVRLITSPPLIVVSKHDFGIDHHRVRPSSKLAFSACAREVTSQLICHSVSLSPRNEITPSALARTISSSLFHLFEVITTY